MTFKYERYSKGELVRIVEARDRKPKCDQVTMSSTTT
jgi:hypothetical protein